jgi:hypothetical protein
LLQAPFLQVSVCLDVEEKAVGTNWSYTIRLIGAAIGCATLTACAPLLMTAVSAGGSRAVSHTLDGVSYRTFTAPLPRVKDASLSALNRMGVESASAEKSDQGETIVAQATERDIEINLESLTAKATRMRVTAKNGLFRDTATSAEIVAQIEKALGQDLAAAPTTNDAVKPQPSGAKRRQASSTAAAR